MGKPRRSFLHSYFPKKLVVIFFFVWFSTTSFLTKVPTDSVCKFNSCCPTQVSSKVQSFWWQPEAKGHRGSVEGQLGNARRSLLGCPNRRSSGEGTEMTNMLELMGHGTSFDTFPGKGFSSDAYGSVLATYEAVGFDAFCWDISTIKMLKHLHFGVSGSREVPGFQYAWPCVFNVPWKCHLMASWGSRYGWIMWSYVTLHMRDDVTYGVRTGQKAFFASSVAGRVVILLQLCW